MLTIFTEKAQLLSKQPSELVTLTHAFLNQAAAFHHPHNKLIPAQYVKQLLNIFESYQLTTTNIDAAYQLLATNALSVLLRANFGQLSQNKLYGALLLQYTIILQNLSKQIKSIDFGQISHHFFKIAARGIILSKIVNKLLERTHSFLPQFYRFARILLQAIHGLLSKTQFLNSAQEPLGKIDLQKVALRMCFSKKVSLNNLVCLLKYLKQQISQFTGICAPASELEIVSTIRAHYEQIVTHLPSIYKEMLLDGDQQSKQNKNEDIYLEETIAVRQLTPRFYDEQQTFVVNKLRQKKLKLKKKIENDLRKDVLVRQQEVQILQDVRKEKIQRQHKKELFVIQKQTAQARKFQRSMQKVKKIRKGDKGKTGGKGVKGGKVKFGMKGSSARDAAKSKLNKRNKHKASNNK